jgi:membrane protease YdiL (CAAX protease family)
VTGRLVAWLAFVGAFIALAYSSRAAGGEPDEDVLYKYGTAVAGLVQYAIVLAIVLWITRGPRQRDLLALRAPRSWRGAVGWSLFVIVAIYIVSAIAEPFLNPGEEQGLTPDSWEPAHAWAYVANFVVIACVTPIVEELMFRGAGYSLLARFGQAVAIVVTGVTFGLIHGLVEALVVLTAFGIGLAWLRAKTDSVYPCIAVHSVFNAVALIVAVTVTT